MSLPLHHDEQYPCHHNPHGYHIVPILPVKLWSDGDHVVLPGDITFHHIYSADTFIQAYITSYIKCVQP